MTARTRWDAIAEGTVTIPASETLGFRITGREGNEVAFEWEVPAAYCNSTGNLQGGVLAAFADALLGGATSTELPEESYPALAEMKISILRPAPAGTLLVGRGRVLKAGPRVLFAAAEIHDRDGVLIATASGTEIPARA